MIDHFWRLRLPWDADDDAIRHAYHHLARQVHPDLTPAGAPTRERTRREHAMARLNESFAVLEDPTARAAHRAALEAQYRRRHPRRAAAAPTPTPRPTHTAPTPPTPPAPRPTIDDEPPGTNPFWTAPRRPRRPSWLDQHPFMSRLVFLAAALLIALVANIVKGCSSDTTTSAPAAVERAP